MNGRRLLPFVLSGAIVLLAALAYASDVDPNWGGLYDGDDGDYVVLLVTGHVSAVEPAPVLEVAYELAVVGTAGHADSAGRFSVSRSLPDSRSPPAS